MLSRREMQLKANERGGSGEDGSNANPPVCKIMDYSKYLYEQSKREKEARKKQTTIEVKEIRLSAKIEEHDFNFKVKNAIKFLEDGDKVKATIRFRGREIAYSALGQEVMNKFAESVKEYGKVDRQPSMEGRTMSMIFSQLKNNNREEVSYMSKLKTHSGSKKRFKLRPKVKRNQGYKTIF